MPVPFILCRNKTTDAVAEIPETALRHLANWVPLSDEERAAAAAQDATADTPRTADDSAGSGADAAPETRPAPAVAGKSKAAKAITSSKEG